MGFSEVRTMVNYESSELTKAVIEEYNPDAVIMLYFPGVVTEEMSGFEFEDFLK